MIRIKTFLARETVIFWFQLTMIDKGVATCPNPADRFGHRVYHRSIPANSVGIMFDHQGINVVPTPTWDPSTIQFQSREYSQRVLIARGPLRNLAFWGLPASMFLPIFLADFIFVLMRKLVSHSRGISR